LDEHLRSGCSHCELHIMEFRKTAASFAEHAAPVSAPPITLRTRVLALTGISALSSSPDSHSEAVPSSHSQEASCHPTGVGERLQNGSEPALPTPKQLVNSPRVPVDPPAKRVEHEPTRGKHLPLRTRDGQTPSPEQQG
jgi:hypothetical protein